MKVDRLYAITVYLLNHGRTSARELSKYFEVSVRTIQRDIDSLCLAGIPIISISGISGGYEIAASFKLNQQLATSNDYSYILTALGGLVSATNDLNVKNTLEKISCIQKQNDMKIILDFSVLQEGKQETLQLLQTAIVKKYAVDFTYTNNDNETRKHCVEPVAVVYRWYAWYLLAYSKVKKDYRSYKLVRMSDLKITDISFSIEHDIPQIILERIDKQDNRQYIEIIVECTEKAQSRVQEYLNGVIIKKIPNGKILMKLTVVENEQLWIGTLLSLGNEVKVIEPERIRQRIVDVASEIILLYQ